MTPPNGPPLTTDTRPIPRGDAPNKDHARDRA